MRSLVVDLDAEVPATDVREVWLIRSDASGLVSLGLLEGASGRFVVPDGIDLDEFTLVDVSAEPVDGDPAHSGDSIVRGELPEDLTEPCAVSTCHACCAISRHRFVGYRVHRAELFRVSSRPGHRSDVADAGNRRTMHA